MAGNSGKALQDAVPPAGTAVREWTRTIEESQAHARGSGLFLDITTKHLQSQNEKCRDSHHGIR
jgi:hypothetical protein